MDRIEPRRASVLVVEDEPLIRIFLADTLRSAGLEVSEAGTADEAADLIREQKFSVVLTDVCMPGQIDGVELARQVCEECPGTAVIVASATKVRDAVPEGVPFVPKPFDVPQLKKLVEDLVGQPV